MRIPFSSNETAPCIIVCIMQMINESRHMINSVSALLTVIPFNQEVLLRWPNVMLVRASLR